MMRWLIILLVALTAPATPATSCATMAPMTARTHAAHGSDHTAPMPVEHVCIGCIAVADWDGARVAPPVPAAALPPAMRVAALPLLPGQAPTPPPPRAA